MSGSIFNDDLSGTAVTGNKVVNNSLTGNQIDEATLAGVNADKVDGFDAIAIDYRAMADSGNTIIFDLGGLRLTASCAAGDLEVDAVSFRNNAAAFVFAHNNAIERKNWDFTAFDVVNEDDNTAGTLVYSRPDGIDITIDFFASEDPYGPDTPDKRDCVFTGTAFVK